MEHLTCANGQAKLCGNDVRPARFSGRYREETMSFLDDDRPAPKPKFAVDDDLALLSLEELEERIAAFKAEIKRNEEDLERKRKSLSAADSVFKI